MSARTPASYHPRQLISVLIPVHNGGGELARCLDAVMAQLVGDEIEVLVIDSGSTDDTVSIAEAHGARVHSVPHSDFHHGATRNLGAQLARGEIVVWTTHDA